MILITTFFVKFSSSKRMGAPTDKLTQGLAETLLKSGGTKDHFRQVKVPGTTPY
jgi:hypothetical protein